VQSWLRCLLSRQREAYEKHMFLERKLALAGLRFINSLRTVL